MRRSPNRRGILTGAAGLLGAAFLGGCDRIATTDWGRRTLKLGEDANLFVQRLLLTPTSLAHEFSEADISPWFKPNGTIDPQDKSYKALAKDGFTSFRLTIDGHVEQPQELSLAELRALPARTQITRHDCVEGWSAIGKWTGVPLAALLTSARLKPNARYVVFHCADTMEMAGGGLEGGEEADAESGEDGQGGRPIRYYESIDLADAFHPQTIVAYDMNGKALPVSNGAPLRLRIERQLGYKQAKYVMRIEVVDSLSGIGDGQGGYWEDRGYEWYAGI
ncbi:molybdopterin-binding protein [Methylobacterium sp. 77]|uniref:molybdopterin-binding protein n=1 Tax=Methylobacterium sp. 77 TaxID=1101192 RepID=UPI00036A9CB8|nr:molybdopterin-binding protein [Methylobacterium sp. 77]